METRSLHGVADLQNTNQNQPLTEAEGTKDATDMNDVVLLKFYLVLLYN